MAQPQSGSTQQSRKAPIKRVPASRTAVISYPFKIYTCILRIVETWLAKNRVAPPEMIVDGDDEWSVHLDHGRQQIVVSFRPNGHKNFKLRKQGQQLMALIGDINAKTTIHPGIMEMNANAKENPYQDTKGHRMVAQLDKRREEMKAERDGYAARAAEIEKELSEVLPPTTYRIDLMDIVQGVPDIASEVIEL